jgi:hypothetical protein
MLDAGYNALVKKEKKLRAIKNTKIKDKAWLSDEGYKYSVFLSKGVCHEL